MMQTILTDTIPIIYKGNTYDVDRNLICQASIRFSDLMKTYISNGQTEKPQLEILYENFSERNILNFLKICQNLPVDVQNNEIPEICEIALMFQANEIYSKAINFVHSNIDQNFSIPENKYNQDISKFFNFTSSKNLAPHHINFSELEFESDESDNDYFENTNKCNNTENMKDYHNDEKCDDFDGTSTIYLIKSELLSRGQRFIFLKNNKPLLSAKVKGNKIFFSNKDDTNFDTNSQNVLYRIERERDLTNKVILNNQKFDIKHILGNDTHFSMETSFQLNDKTISWVSKEKDLKTNSSEYKSLISGMFNRPFKKSDKNIALKDKNGKTQFIVRKVWHHSFEVECSPDLPEMIVFSIAVTQIVGPLFDSSEALTYGRENVIPTIPFSIA